jgi:lipoate---protein ligase
MADRWRLIVDDGASASFGLAADEYLMSHWAGPGNEFGATLRLYTYRSHCALVGRFQDTAAEVRLAECQRLGVAVNRRPTGGGAILMGGDQLGIALTLDGGRADLPPRPGQLFQQLVAGVAAGLEMLGVEARFRPKNDLEAGARKIAGLGLCRDVGGGLLFHTSLLVDLDVKLMLQVLNIPPEKLTDKLLRYVADRTTTLKCELGRPVTVEEARRAVATGYARAFGVELLAQPFSRAELDGIASLEANRYATDAWVYQRRLADADGDPGQVSRSSLAGGCFGPRSSRVGVAVHKTGAGLLRVYVALSGETTIKSALVTGDFFADSASLARFEARLKWAPAERSAIDAAATAEFSSGPAPAPDPDPAGIAHLNRDELVDVVCRAADNARRVRRTA